MQSANQHATRIVPRTERAARRAWAGRTARDCAEGSENRSAPSPSQDHVVGELGGEVDLQDVKSGDPSDSKHQHQSAPDTHWHQSEGMPRRPRLQRRTRERVGVENTRVPAGSEEYRNTHHDQPFTGKLAELGQLPPEPRLGPLRGRRRGVRKAQVGPAADDVLAPRCRARQHGRLHERLGGSERVGEPVRLMAKNGRKNVKSARYRPILSADRRRQRPAPTYLHADPAQNGQNGGN